MNQPPRADRGPSTTPPAPEPEPAGEDSFAWLGERLRRVALGLTAMLFVVRAYFPSEDAEGGSGLIWAFAILATSAIAVASFLFSGVRQLRYSWVEAEAVARPHFPGEDAPSGLGVNSLFEILVTSVIAILSSLRTGTTRLRWSWADAAVLALMVLVGMSTAHAADRRPAITMAWEWAGLGLLYFLARNLPRTRAESATMAGAVAATAVAVAAYGLYQIPVEFEQLRKMFQARPDLVMLQIGVTPGTPAADAFRNRLFSNEPFSTFALPNSLAGFLVGPMALAFAVALENFHREGRGSRLQALALAAIPGLILLACLMLTKSRSAQISLFVALLVLAWRARRSVPTRVLAFSGVGLAALVVGLVVAGVATRQLDLQVITEGPKSLKYRWEYWVGTWGVITDAPSPYVSTGLGAVSIGPAEADTTRSSSTFWSGLGPANFAIPYLRHKLPEASEEIQDPHNMVLETWVTGGLFAPLALLAALGIGLRETLGPPRGSGGEKGEPSPDLVPRPGRDPGAPPARSGWLLASAGLGWLAVWVMGKLNPMTQADLLARWIILGAGWGLAVLLGGALWRRRPIPASGLGVAVLALSINLLAAGGIGIPSVAMSLWVLLALGLNLRDDRPCGRLRVAGGLGTSVLLALAWAALAGTFFGAVVPAWKSDAAFDQGNALMAMHPPAYEPARAAYTRAVEADHYSVKPWLALADLEYQYWRSPEVFRRKEPRWTKVLILIDNALDPKWRNPNSLAVRRRQAAYARAILRDLPEDAKPIELIDLKGTIAKACRWCARIYPTSATIRAELAQASADIGMYPDAVREAKQALLLDGRTPHDDKKLPRRLRDYLKAEIPRWEEIAAAPPPTVTPKAPAPAGVPKK